jgi:cytochrome c oxidase assembly protein subunit 15
MNSKTIWLTICIALIYAMVILGGYTRLSHSGLSIVEWKPITGIFPPFNQDSWESEFISYQKTPEYKQINYGMELNEFKQIFLVEYFHRLLGRIIGLAFLIPFLYFILTKRLLRQEIIYFSFVFILIGLQGAIGWFMVKSGLVNQPNVSQYRLALHLLMACIILILLVWKLFPHPFKPNAYSIFSLSLLLLQIISGAFVAGLKAGLIYNTFPLMDGKIIPDGLFIINPWYKNIFENVTLVQFIHRVLGAINLANILAYSYKILKISRKKYFAKLLAALIIAQFAIGILTLILQVPLLLGLLHQAIAIMLLIILTASLKENV